MISIKCLLLLFILLPVSISAQIDWVNYQNNPVIDADFDSDSDKVWRPSVIFYNQMYHMWYGKDGGDGVEKMGYATSADGMNWTLVDPTVLEPPTDPTRFDNLDASQGWVIAENDTFKMWYWGNGRNVGNIGNAWSADGINWTKVNGPATDGSVYDRTMDGGTALALATPTVVKDGDTYHMWFSRIIGVTSIGFTGRIGYAVSSDGINWTNVPGSGTDGAVIDWGGGTGSFDETTVIWPAAVKTDEGFIMWYQGGSEPQQFAGLGCATSTDGVSWTKVAGSGTNGACFDGVHLASVIKENQQYKMWYGIFGQGNNDEIHLAFSDIVNAIATTATSKTLQDFFLGQNYPNPFNPSTTIRFDLPVVSEILLIIYNPLGQKIRELVDGQFDAGQHQITWDGRDDFNHHAASGVYFLKLSASKNQSSGEFSQVKKMLLLR